jgi:hypothetical protein
MKTGLHIPILLTIVVTVIGVAVVLALFQRSWRSGPPDPDPDDGLGGPPKGPDPDSPPRPRGGLPLAHAVPARVRLRDAVRLADRLPRRPRRHVREPERAPVRETTPS